VPFELAPTCGAHGAARPARIRFNGKIQRAERAKAHAMLVIGGRVMDAGAVSVRLHGKGSWG